LVAKRAGWYVCAADGGKYVIIFCAAVFCEKIV